MTARALALDMSRLWLAGLRTTPRGIERVDHALAREVVANWPGDLFGVTWTPWGLRCVERATLARLVAHVEAVWREQDDAEADPVFLHLRDWLQGRTPFRPQPPVSRARHQFGKALRALHALRAAGVSAGLPGMALPHGTVFASFGHVGLLAPGIGELLDRRRDIRLCALMHDIISMTDPQFFPPRNDGYFRQVFERAVGRSDLILTTTAHVRSEILAQIARRGGEAPAVQPVSIASTFAQIPLPHEDAALHGQPYFMVCATLEPRKNHTLLLGLWREMALQSPSPPKLILAGGRGWGSELIAGALNGSRRLVGHVAHTPFLSSPGLFRLLGEARGLLAPSFSEGYGLPVAEALSMGTPVVASAIPAFEDITRGEATLLDPLDGPSWRSRIERLAAETPDNSQRLAKARAFRSLPARDSDLVTLLREI